MKQMNHILGIMIILISFSACQTDKNYKPNVTGVAGDVLVVIDDTIKASVAGELIRNMLTQPVLGLPQDEPIFNMIQTPQRAFPPYMKTLRNLIVIEVGSNQKNDTILFYNDYYAQSQAYISIKAKNTSELSTILKNNEVKIISFLLKAERTRGITYINQYPEQQIIKSIQAQWGISLTIPNSYKKNKGSDTFSWFSEEGPVQSLGIIIYAFDYVGEGSFSREHLLNKRDSVLMKNLPGAALGSYMTTEHEFPAVYKAFELDGIRCAELRGLWKTQGDLMGGPFISHAHYDKPNNRIIVTEGYVYSPEKPNKRNFMRQLESILYTYKPFEEPKK